MSEVQNTGQFSKVIVTTAGKEMIAKSQNGQTLTFTRVALGDGLIENEDDPVNFTAIKNERLSAPIAKYTDRGNGQFELQFRVSNQEVETGFWHREIGVMAKIDEGEEQLYAYTTAGNKANFLYDKTTPIEERIVNVAFIIGNAQNVQVVVNSSIIYVTLEDMEEALDTHNSSADSHAEAFAQHDNNEDSHAPAFKKHNDDENSHEPAFTKHNNDENAHLDMQGATAENAGVRGMVPAPKAGEQEMFLRGDGKWASSLTKADLLDMIYPVGSIYMSVNSTSPDVLFGGTWEEMPAGRVLLAQGESEWGTTYEAGSTGGEATHQLTVGEMPSHAHTATTQVAGNHTHKIIADQVSSIGKADSIACNQGVSQYTQKGITTSGGDHSHVISVGNTGNNQAHNNLQPYISVYIWKRIY